MFTVEYAKNLFWCDAEHTFFECVVKYKEFDGELPVGVNGTDKYPHIQELWVKGNAGEYGAITEYVAPPEPSLPPEDQPTTTGAQTL
jgi:hypothetical protein